MEPDLKYLIERINSLESEVLQLKKNIPPQLSWISKKDFMFALGHYDHKRGKWRPMVHSAFVNMVRESNGQIEIIKIGRQTWVTKYPTQGALQHINYMQRLVELRGQLAEVKNDKAA